ncbi:MAG: preprotein translocase subunit YajC [Phycisphaerae bacterium]
MIALIQILAQNTKQQGPPSSATWIGLILMIGVFYFVLFRGNPKSKKKRAEMFDNLAKNDKVMTIGGVIGTVVAIKDKEIVVKVDETTNTKMTFLKSAIQSVVQDDSDLNLGER